MIQLQTEIFMHDLTGGFPRDEAVTDLTKSLTRQCKHLLEQYNGGNQYV